MNINAPKANILLVDDDPLFARMYERLLLKAGYAVQIAKNGKEALERMQDAAPSLVTLDILMPEMNGLETLRAIKQNPRLSHIPVVILTSIASNANKTLCLETGASGYYIKDIKTAKTFLEGLETILG